MTPDFKIRNLILEKFTPLIKEDGAYSPMKLTESGVQLNQSYPELCNSQFSVNFSRLRSKRRGNFLNIPPQLTEVQNDKEKRKKEREIRKQKKEEKHK